MFCAQCGTQNDNGSAFCRSCGQPLQAVPVSATAQGQAAGYQPTPYPTQASYQRPPAPEGVLGAAWRDITGTRGWLKKVLFLCLIGCVPILNFSVQGYALRWARELSFGERNPLPKEVFKKKEILTGFRAWLTQVSLGFVFGILAVLAVLLISAFFGLFSLQAGIVMGVIALIAVLVGFCFFWLPIVNASIMRMTVVDYLEAALNLPKVFGAFRRSMGGAIGATVIPPLLVFLANLVIGFIFGAIIGAIASSSVPSSYDMYGMLSYYDYGPSRALGNILGAGAGVLFCYILMEIIAAMLSTFGMLVTWRAMGHWAARSAIEWANESDEETILRMAESRSTADVPHSTADAPHSTADAPTGFVPPVSVPTSDDATVQLTSVPPSSISLRRVSTGAVYALDRLPATVGKGTAADVVIDNTESISRVHVRISRAAAGFLLEDLNATNGTSVNGVALASGSSAPLSDGDTVTLAGEDFVVSVR